MTTRKHFKRLVRERMTKTGERYSVARAHVAGEGDDGWELRGGVHPDTAALANVLANLGVVAPHTGAPLSEAMILGIGGGLGAGYILWEFAEHGERILVLGFRREWQYPARWSAATAERLGLHAELHETGSARAAATRLDETLDRGLPAIVWIDAYRLGHRELPASHDGKGGPPVVVYGRDGDALLVDDRSTGRLRIGAERVADARARVGSYRHRLIAVDPALVEIDRDRLVAAVRDSLDLQVAHLRERSDSFSLPTWRKWARLLTSTRNAKAWPRVFADGRGVASVLAGVYTEAGPAGPSAANLRALYADFLDEAEGVAGRSLGDAAAAWRAAAGAWERAIDLALPTGDDDGLGRLRALIDASETAIAGGDAARGRARAVAAERWALQQQLDARIPAAASSFAALAEAIEAVYVAESAALDTLEAALR